MRPELIQNLNQAEVWPDGASDLQLHETHISWVFVTDHFAWKIKKPVSFAFLDFSTLQKREHFCHEELRLNRRLAPQLYLDVVPITGSVAEPRISGEGAPIEFAVKMLRFEQHDLFSERIQRGELRSEDMDDLAVQLARFHQAAAVVPHDQECGSSDAIRAAAEENFETLRNHAELPSTRQLLQKLAAWTSQSFDQLKSVFERRRADGFIRECHGDLHLGNIVQFEGRPCIFDGIEFNDDFRWIDVINEVAFLVMDLDEHGRDDLGWRFLNTYLEQTGDYAGLQVLSFYLVYRSLVRAKIDAIRLSNSSVPVERRQFLVGEFRGYLNVAGHDAQTSRPLMILMHGLSGSGKSTVARQLGERFGAIRIRSDVERKRLSGLSPLEHPDPEMAARLYSEPVTQQTFDRLLSLATTTIDAGFTVIVDATFLLREQRARFTQAAQTSQVPCVIVSCQADLHTMRSRLEARQRIENDPSDADIAVLEKQLAFREPLDVDGETFVISYDTESPDSLANCLTELTRIRESVSSQPPSVSPSDVPREPSESDWPGTQQPVW